MPVSLREALMRLMVLSFDILLAWLLHKLLRRFAPRVLALLTGGRF